MSSSSLQILHKDCFPALTPTILANPYLQDLGIAVEIGNASGQISYFLYYHLKVFVIC